MKAVVLSQDQSVLTTCEYISKIVGVEWSIEEDIADLLLNIQENDFDLILFDIEKFGDEGLKWLQHIHQLRPRIPVIITCPCVTSAVGADMLDRGAYYLAEKPLDDKPLVEIIQKLRTQILNDRKTNV